MLRRTSKADDRLNSRIFRCEVAVAGERPLARRVAKKEPGTLLERFFEALEAFFEIREVPGGRDDLESAAGDGRVHCA